VRGSRGKWEPHRLVLHLHALRHPSDLLLFRHRHVPDVLRGTNDAGKVRSPHRVTLAIGTLSGTDTRPRMPAPRKNKDAAFTAGSVGTPTGNAIAVRRIDSYTYDVTEAFTRFMATSSESR
jgi:hypothetical protein